MALPSAVWLAWRWATRVAHRASAEDFELWDVLGVVCKSYLIRGFSLDFVGTFRVYAALGCTASDCIGFTIDSFSRLCGF